MATLCITEFSQIGVLTGRLANEVQAPRMPAVAVQQIAVGAGSVQSAAFNAQTQFVELTSDVDCHVTFDDDPVAVAATSTYIPAKVPRWYTVYPGQKLAVIN